MHVIETCSAHLGDMRSKFEVAIKNYTKIPSRASRRSVNVQKTEGEKRTGISHVVVCGQSAGTLFCEDSA